MAQWDRAGLGRTLKHLAQRARRNTVVPKIVLSQALVPKPRREGGRWELSWKRAQGTLAFFCYIKA